MNSPPAGAAPSVADWSALLGPLGFGGAALGNLYSEVGDAEAEAALAAAIAGGVRYFDTAPFYGYGLSERRMGRAIGRRADLLVSTKVGRLIVDVPPEELPDDGFAVAGGRAARWDYSRDGVLRSVEESLARLRRDRVSILYLHDVGALTHGERHTEMLAQALDEALPALADLRAAGVCDAIGIGVNEEAVCLEILPRFDLDLILLAGRYTLLEQATLGGVMAEARRRGTGIVVGGPFNSGLLAPPYRPGSSYDYAAAGDAVRARAERIYALCRRFGADPGAAALQFPLAHPAVATVIAGMRSAAEAESAVARSCAQIPPALWEAFRAEGLLAEEAPVP